MVTFKQFINESKFAPVPQATIEYIVSKINIIIDQYKTGDITAGYAAYIKHYGTKKVLICRLKLKSNTIKFYIKGGHAAAGTYSEDKSEVIFSASELISRSKAAITGLVAHEVRHAIQEYSATSSNYDTAAEHIIAGTDHNKQHYYLEPAEFEAQSVGLAHNIATDIQRIIRFYKNRATPGWESIVRREIAKYIDIIRFHDISVITRYALPPVMAEHYNFIHTVATNPKLWKKLRLKLYHLLRGIQHSIETK